MERATGLHPNQMLERLNDVGVGAHGWLLGGDRVRPRPALLAIGALSGGWAQFVGRKPEPHDIIFPDTRGEM